MKTYPLLALVLTAVGLLGISCAISGVYSRAARRQEAAYRLAACLRMAPDFPAARTECVLESAAYCRSVGLEDGCGIDGQWPGEHEQLKKLDQPMDQTGVSDDQEDRLYLPNLRRNSASRGRRRCLRKMEGRRVHPRYRSRPFVRGRTRSPYKRHLP